VAQENDIPINKCIGFYKLNDQIITSVDKIISRYDLDYIPQIHCFLKFSGKYLDLTEGNCNGKNKIIDEYDFIIDTEPDLSDQRKEEYYIQYLKKYMEFEEKLNALGIKKILNILREVNEMTQNKCSII
jgi:hypothetical protein